MEQKYKKRAIEIEITYLCIRFQSYDRPSHTRTTPPRDVAHPRQRHQARAEGAAMAVAARLPLSPQREERARQARHRHAAVSDGDFCEWVFLARPPCRDAINRVSTTSNHQFIMLQDSADEPGVLGEQNQEEPRARPAELPGFARQRLAGHRGVGMSTDAQAHRGDDAACGAAAQRTFLGLAPTESGTLRCSGGSYFYGSGRRQL